MPESSHLVIVVQTDDRQKLLLYPLLCMRARGKKLAFSFGYTDIVRYKCNIRITHVYTKLEHAHTVYIRPLLLLKEPGYEARI